MKKDILTKNLSTYLHSKMFLVQKLINISLKWFISHFSISILMVFYFHEYTSKINDFVTFGFPFGSKGEFKGKLCVD